MTDKIEILPEQGVQLIGREEKITQLLEVLSKPQSGSHLLFNGMGGIGKTSICRELAFRCVKNVNAVIWVDCQNGIESNLETKISPELGVNIQQSSWFKALLDKLKQYQPPAVMFLDNLEPSDANRKILKELKRLNWHLIATSRYPLDEFSDRYSVDVLSPEHCVELFKKYYEGSVDDGELGTLDLLIKLAGRHTLTVELLAKTASESCCSVSEIYEQVKATGFDLSNLTDAPVAGHHSGTEAEAKRQHQLHEHLSKLFELSHLTDREQDILRLLSILPYQAYDCRKELMVWLGLDKPEILKNLEKKGWLQRADKSFSFAVHPVVAHVVKKEIPLDSELVSEFALRFDKAIQPDETGHWIFQAHYEKPLKELIDTEEVEDRIVGLMLSSLAEIYEAQCKYKEALALRKRALAIVELIYDKGHSKIATCQNNLALVYDELGEYDKAVELYERALASDLKTYGENHPEVATDRNNLADVFRAQGECQKAIELFQMALDSNIKTHGEDHPNVAAGRNNLAGVFEDQGEYQKAIELYQLALESDIRTYDENHPKVALRQHNLAFTYNSMGEYEKAIPLFQQALVVFQKCFDENHPYLQSTIIGLAQAIANLEASKKP